MFSRNSTRYDSKHAVSAVHLDRNICDTILFYTLYMTKRYTRFVRRFDYWRIFSRFRFVSRVLRTRRNRVLWIWFELSGGWIRCMEPPVYLGTYGTPRIVKIRKSVRNVCFTMQKTTVTYFDRAGYDKTIGRYNKNGSFLSSRRQYQRLMNGSPQNDHNETFRSTVYERDKVSGFV